LHLVAQRSGVLVRALANTAFLFFDSDDDPVVQARACCACCDLCASEMLTLRRTPAQYAETWLVEPSLRLALSGGGALLAAVRGARLWVRCSAFTMLQ
jgi:hypothetical protein